MISRSLKAVRRIVNEKYPPPKSSKTSIKQRWYNDAQQRTLNFVQADEHLRKMMLERCDGHWQEWFEKRIVSSSSVGSPD
jgi:hypothetical protein